MISDEAAKRIAAASRLKHGRSIAELHDDLEMAARDYEMAQAWRDACATAPTKGLEAAAKAALRLKKSLDDPRVWDAIRSQLITAECPRESLDRLIEAIDAARKPPEPQPEWAADTVAEIADYLAVNNHSALTVLLGKLLPEVFEKHFRARAGLSRASQGALGGPYVRFARATLKELQISCKDETIARALTDVRADRVRRTLGKPR